MRSMVTIVHLPLLVLGLTVAPVVSLAQWSHLGLTGRNVMQLRSHHGLLFACTNDGLYRKTADTADSAWVLMGFSGQTVHDVLAPSAETLLIAREITGSGADTVAVLRSTDGGASWGSFQNGLGADGSAAARKVTALLEPAGALGTVLAATQDGIARSADGGLTWKRVSVGGRFFFLAAGPSTLWAGGEGATFGPIARYSTDNGVTWTSSPLSGSADRAVAIAFDPSDTNGAFLGLLGGLRRTSNGGVSWSTIPLPFGVGSTALGNRSLSPVRLFANGYPPPQGATFYKSDDTGVTWTPMNFGGAGNTFARTMLVRSGPASDTVFLGMGSGVLRFVEVEPVDVAISMETRMALRAYPNPLHSEATLAFRLPHSSHVSLKVFDSGGRLVTILLNGVVDAGPHWSRWQLHELSSGTYFCQLETCDGRAMQKLIVFR